MFKCHRQFMERQMGGLEGGGGGREMTESVLKKDNHCLGKKQADFDSDIFAPP